ncbi:MAG: enoyl-CoA hydratase-related protein [Myxococcota bacterium]
MSYETLSVEDEGALRTITLRRPTAANALDLTLAEELFRAATAADADPGVRAVLLTGEGRFFCAGGDVRAFREEADALGDFLRRITTYLHGAVSRFHRMDAPLVVAVNGTAAGGGFSLAIGGDLVLAARSARFTMRYASIGLSPDGTSTYFLPRLVGLRRAQELMLTDRMLSAEEAADWGLVTKVVDDDALMEEARELARRLADGPTGAYGAVKRLLASSFASGLETQAELETRAIAGRGVTADGREGIAAFLEKRPPSFRGD